MDSLYSQFMNSDSLYYGFRAKDKFFDKNANKECEKFIKRFFRVGQKESALKFAFRKEYLTNGKHVHTVSVYLLGELIHKHHKDYVNDYIDEKTRYPFAFEYYWFLTSLYHDVASCIEKINDPHKVEKLYKETQGKQYDIFNHLQNSITHIEVPLRFPCETIDSYAEWRKRNSSNDHGILAGKLLYKRLLRNFYEKTRDCDWCQQCEKIVNNRKFRPEQIDLFAIVADAVMCHNIWMAYDSEKIKEYEDNRLNDLIIRSPQERLSVSDYPLQFFLNLIDTIEPTKRFVSDSFSVKDVLQNIFIKNTSKKLTIGWTKEIKKQPLFFKWIGDISELQKWLSVNVSECYHKDKMCCIDIIIE